MSSMVVVFMAFCDCIDSVSAERTRHGQECFKKWSLMSRQLQTLDITAKIVFMKEMHEELSL